MNEKEIRKEIKSLNASFAMSGMIITEEEEKIASDILSGKRNVEDVIDEITKKAMRKNEC